MLQSHTKQLKKVADCTTPSIFQTHLEELETYSASSSSESDEKSNTSAEARIKSDTKYEPDDDILCPDSADSDSDGECEILSEEQNIEYIQKNIPLYSNASICP